MFHGGPFPWASKKKNLFQYQVPNLSTSHRQWTAQIFKEMLFPKYICLNQKTVQMFGYNQGALALVRNPDLHKRSNHIDICYHFIRDLAEIKKLQLDYIPTAEMVADGMTKPLSRIAYQSFMDKIVFFDVNCN